MEEQTDTPEGRTECDGEAEVVPRRPPRRIILFSDGTGNSSGKLFKTNVWRLYEALDLGPAGIRGPEQVALYSNGVGTSAFRPMAMLGGVFGIGLKSNVLLLYKFLCRNWMPGDEIFLFGFSRGAFTIRLLAGLIAHQGILRGGSPDMPPDEDRLAYLARAVYREFARETWPNRWPARTVSRLVRAVRDSLLDLHRRLVGRERYDGAANSFTDIAFVGVWDTVAAYGGPIIEITRGIDDWIWPLTMPNLELSPRVLKARHALSLDDERDAFQPLLWDEVREDALVKWGGSIRVAGGRTARLEVRQVPAARLGQVWFAGVHADVGGGYSDESLSFVSLTWMIDELDEALRLLPEHVRRISSMANAYGPIHDSRAGLGRYYRYQPRRIAALTDWRRPAKPPGPGEQAGDFGDAELAQRAALAIATRSMRDPETSTRGFALPDREGSARTEEIAALEAHIGRDHGLLTSVRVHESVLARILSGTDNYAPVGLPRRFDIAFAGPDGVSQRMLDPVNAARIQAERRRMTSEGGWFPRQARTWDMVGTRRLFYFLTVLPTLLLVTMPLWDNLLPRDHGWTICADTRCVAQPVLELLNGASGGYAGPWVDAFSVNFLLAIILGAVGALMFFVGDAYELRLRALARRGWRGALGIEAPAAADLRRSPFARLRDGRAYQWANSMLKWYVAPFGAGMLILAVLLLAMTSLTAQLLIYPLAERHDLYCKDGALHSRVGEAGVTFPMSIARPCKSAAVSVEARQVYSIRITPLRNTIGSKALAEGWFDGRLEKPLGARGADLPWWKDLIGVPFRRVTRSGWLQPLVAVQAPYQPDSLWQRLFGRPVWIEEPKLACDPGSQSYIGRFRAARAGSLRIFVNDAPALRWIGSGYFDNHGLALVQIRKGADMPPPARPRKGRVTPLPLPCLVDEK